VGLFSRRVQGLQEVFPSSQRSLSQPSVLDDTVVPCFFFPGPLARFGEMQAADVAGALGVDQVAFTAVPADRVRHVIYADIFHDDGAAQRLEFAVQIGTAPGAPVTISQCTSAYVAGGILAFGIPANEPYALTQHLARGVFLPPNSVLLANARPGVGAGSTLTARARWIDYPLADLPSF